MKSSKRKPKIFCIGFNKTGSMSLSEYFRLAGIKCAHNVVWPHYSQLKFGKYYFYRYDCYADGERANFIQLKRWFPHSLFVLNTRDEMDWLRSRIKHVMRWNEKPSLPSLLESDRYGAMAKDFFFDERQALRKWIAERILYEKQVRTYFDGMKSFVEIDITSDPAWQSELATFLTDNGVRHNAALVNTIKLNARESQAIKDDRQLQQYYQLAEEVSRTR